MSNEPNFIGDLVQKQDSRCLARTIATSPHARPGEPWDRARPLASTRVVGFANVRSAMGDPRIVGPTHVLEARPLLGGRGSRPLLERFVKRCDVVVPDETCDLRDAEIRAVQITHRESSPGRKLVTAPVGVPPDSSPHGPCF